MHQQHSTQEARYRRASFWLDSVPGTLAPRPALQQELSADVVIVGAGYSGLWTAYYLKQHAPGLEIVVLEAEIAGFGASGRNGGWCSAYLAGLEQQAAHPATRAAAIELQDLMNATVADVGRVCATAGIDCHFEQSGHVAAAVIPAHEIRLRNEVTFMHSLGFGEHDFRWLDAREMAEKLHIDGARGGYHMAHCAAIHPARLARGLAQVAEASGVRIFEHSAVTGFTKDGVRTDHGQVSADHVLLATEGFTGRLPGLGRKLIPVHSTMVATEPLNARQLASVGMQARHTFSDGNHVVTYGQLTGDGRIAFGCRGRYRFGSGIRTDYRQDDRVFRFVQQELLRLFPGLEGVRFTHAWGGPMGVSRTLRPAVVYDRQTRRGWCGGYFGNGVGATHLAGQTLADLVLGRDTQRSRALWVNPPRERELNRKLWEPEPLRWLGINTRARLMGMVDRAEHRQGLLARPLGWVLENLFP